jgi:hypothetical protein
LAWAKNSEPDIAGYKMHYGTTSGSYDYSVDVGNYTSCTISGLQEGETYYFAATAYDTDNFESNLSEEFAYKIPAEDSGGGGTGYAGTTVIEAEQMSHYGNGLQRDPYWLMLGNGTIVTDADFSNSGTYRIEIAAKADLAHGVGPEMKLLIDGQVKGSVFVNTNTPQIYTFEVEVPAGTHEVAIAFNNDYYKPAKGIDRNLYVDKIAIVSSTGYLATEVIEAEQMSHYGYGLQRDPYWLMLGAGTINADANFPNSGTYHIEITAKADIAHGVGPEMELLIDGQSKGSVFVNTNTPEIYTFEIEVSAGMHEVTIAFGNDYYEPATGIDRNLYVDKIAIVSSPGYLATEVIEAEQMSHYGYGLQSEPYWLMLGPGTINADADFSNAGTYRFEITAKADIAHGVGPEMELLVDGQVKGSVFVNTETPQIYMFEVEVSASTHEVAIAFNNDYYDPAQSVDRNLYVDKIAIVSSPGYLATEVIEAEQMSHYGIGRQSEPYWLMLGAGTINTDADFPNSGTYRFEITAKADIAHGVGPEMELLIDGQVKGSVFVNTETPQIYMFEVEVSASTHEVAIAFDNDYYDPATGIDRNLYVDKIAISYHLQ